MAQIHITPASLFLFHCTVHQCLQYAFHLVYFIFLIYVWESVCLIILFKSGDEIIAQRRNVTFGIKFQVKGRQHSNSYAKEIATAIALISLTITVFTWPKKVNYSANCCQWSQEQLSEVHFLVFLSIWMIKFVLQVHWNVNLFFNYDAEKNELQ